MEDTYYVTHKTFKATVEGSLREQNGPIFGPNLYINTFEFVLERTRRFVQSC